MMTPHSFAVKNIDASYIDLYNNLKKITEWAFQWKINFNRDPAEQAQEPIYLINHSLIIVNENIIWQTFL